MPLNARGALLGSVIFLFVSCAQQPEKKVDATAPAPVAPAPVVQAAAEASPAPAADRFADECEAVKRRLHRWDGDKETLDDARERLKDILARDRTYAPAYVQLARVEYSSGYKSGDEFDAGALTRASKFVNHALKLQPDNFDAHCTAGWVAFYQKDLDVAQASIRRAEELKPGSDEVKLLRASVAMAEEELPEMMRLAKDVAAHAADPDSRARAYSILVQGYLSGDHLDEADGAFRELLKLRPDSAWVHGNYAALLLQRDDIDGAVREAEAAVGIRKYPAGVGILVLSYIAKAQALWDANRIAESAAYIQKVAGLADEDARLTYALGQFYERAAIRSRDASMRTKALASYRRTLELDPRHLDAEHAVGRLTRPR